MKLKTAALAIALFSFLEFFCTKDVSGTSEIGNPQKISAFVVDSSGVGVKNLKVTLVPCDYIPDFEVEPDVILTDETGYFSINFQNSSSFHTLFIFNQNMNLFVLIDSLQITVNHAHFDTLILTKPRKVTLYTHDGIQNSYLAITGTVWHTLFGQDDSITADIPAGAGLPSVFSSSGSIINSNPVCVEIPSYTPDYTKEVKDTDLNFNVDIPDITLEYRFDWGDGEYSQWSSNQTNSHRWSSSGQYQIKIQSRLKSDTSAVSSWNYSSAITIIDTHIVSTPDIPSYSGYCSGLLSEECTFFTGGAISSLGDPVEYFWKINSDTSGQWYTDSVYSYRRDSTLLFYISARARSTRNRSVISIFSDSLSVPYK